MLRLFSGRKARQAVQNTVLPLVAQSQRRFGSDGVRSANRYILGFIAGLATRMAMQVDSNIGSDALGLIQAETFSMLSGEDAASVGEEMAFLQISGDHEFLRGVDASMLFFDMCLVGYLFPHSGNGMEPDFSNSGWDASLSGDFNDPSRIQGNEAIMKHWEQLFESHLSPA